MPTIDTLSGADVRSMVHISGLRSWPIDFCPDCNTPKGFEFNLDAAEGVSEVVYNEGCCCRGHDNHSHPSSWTHVANYIRMVYESDPEYGLKLYNSLIAWVKVDLKNPKPLDGASA